ncbi:hypothetical protein B0H16DRAFT_1339042, partial [Mycena metata]
CICLCKKHNVHLVGDAMKMPDRLQSRAHIRARDCVCEDCCDDRLVKRCLNPSVCITALERKLSALLPRWDPRRQSPEPPVPAVEQPGTFRPPPPITSLTEGLRVLTKKLHLKPLQLHAPPVRELAPPQSGTRTIFVGSATVRNGLGELIAGGGLWLGPNHPQNLEIRVPDDQPQTARTAYIISTLVAVQRAPRDQAI